MIVFITTGYGKNVIGGADIWCNNFIENILPLVKEDYKIIIDNIKRALDLCSPLRNLPIEKYDSWKEIILQFDVGKD
jgi:hypothetical protein